MVVFINKKINALSGFITFFVQVIQLFHSTPFGVKPFLYPLGEVLGIDITKEVELGIAMCIQ